MIIPISIKGGPGSGNWGHAGRPGLRGGSTSIGYRIVPSRSMDSVIQDSMGGGQDPFNNSTVVHYIQEGFISINAVLREGDVPGEDIQRHIDGLDAFVSDGSLSDDLVLFRGVGPKHVLCTRFDDLKGETVRDDGFVSTTLDIEQSKQFAGYYAPARWHGVMLEIRARKGQPVGAIGGGEMEILLPRGTRFRVIDTIIEEHPQGYTGKRMIMEIVQ